MNIIITERQHNLLMENIPAALRRRFSYNEIKGHLEFIIQNYNPCDYGSLGDFIGEMCDMLVLDLINDYYYENGGKIDSKTKDNLYYFMVDVFANFLQDIYDKECY
jgi:tRNA(Met) C34 N-acetyltransferase TmcA